MMKLHGMRDGLSPKLICVCNRIGQANGMVSIMAGLLKAKVQRPTLVV